VQVAQFSGPQLVLWYKRVGIERGEEKLIDLDVSIVPHTEHPDRSLKEVRQSLIEMTQQNGRR
jgi:hypothetical protein